jgi:hypothetical protein
VLPANAHIPGAVLLLAGGLLACFAGYRLFRLVLGVYGFILGALFASSLVSPGQSTSMLIAAIVGGAIGALLLTLAYYVGVALIGAGVGAVVAHVIWPQIGHGEPTTLVVLGFGLGGAIAAVFLQRYMIIVGTASGGAWTAIVGVAALVGVRAALPAADAGNAWFGYPFSLRLGGPDAASGFNWMWLAWLVLGVAGLLVQLRSKKRK